MLRAMGQVLAFADMPPTLYRASARAAFAECALEWRVHDKKISNDPVTVLDYYDTYYIVYNT